MNTFGAFIENEIRRGIRTYRFLIIGVICLFFAMADPIILKILPAVLSSQMEGIDFSKIIIINQQTVTTTYMKDCFQVLNIVAAFTLMGIICDEIKNKTIVIPLAKGISMTGLVAAKYIVYTVCIAVFLFAGFMLNFYESSLLFSENRVPFSFIVYAAFLFSLYYMVNISIIAFFSSLFRKPLAAAFSALGLIFIMPLLSNFNTVKKLIPYYLVERLNGLSVSADTGLVVAVILCFVYTGIFLSLTVIRLRRIEIR